MASAHTVSDSISLVAGSCYGTGAIEIDHSLEGVALTWGCGASSQYLSSSFVISGQVSTVNQGWSSYNQMRFEYNTAYIAATHNLQYITVQSGYYGTSVGH
jgi:hypothetical protein